MNTIGFDQKNLLASRAYQLWQKSEGQETIQDRQKKITNQLFFEMKQKNPWFSWFYSLVEFFFPNWMKRKVEIGLSAYKYDLVTLGMENSHLDLFSKSERWFIDQKLVGVFKRILGKREGLNLKTRAKRWTEKVKKYSGKREFIIGNYILYQITQKFPNFKNSIDWMKALNMSYIEKQCRKTLNNVDDDAIVLGVIHYLEQPFDVNKNLTRIITEIGYHVAKEKTKMALKNFYNRVANGICGSYQTIRSYLPFYKDNTRVLAS